MSAVVVTITCAGKKLGPEVGVLELEVRGELDRIPEADLRLLDQSPEARQHKLSEAAHFEPGAEVEIALRREGGADARVFRGLVVRHSHSAREDGVELRVELKHPAIALTRSRRSAVYRDQPDSDVIRKLLGDAGLPVGALDDTAVKHRELVQYQASDWDFIVSRADVCGQVVVLDDKVSVRAMKVGDNVAATIDLCLDRILHVDLTVDAAAQRSGYQGVAWDPEGQKPTAPTDATELKIGASNVDPAAAARRLGGPGDTLFHPVPLSQDELKAWSDARLARARLALVRGTILLDGRPDLRPYDTVKLEGACSRFAGDLLLSGVTHRVDAKGWRTELKIGLSPEGFAHTAEALAAPLAGGLLPPVAGIQLATVASIHEDPDKEYRVKVKLPGLKDDETLLARVARPDAGKGRGLAFWPEVGDEVVLGFLADDPRHPIVLGSLYSQKNTPPAPADELTDANDHRALVTRSGVALAFDDKKASVTLKTPKGNTVVLDDDAGSITLTDQHGNKITMDSEGVKIESAGDFSIDAKGKVQIKGSAVDVQ